MGAWKSSDGGSITPIGGSAATVTPSGSTPTVIVSAAANVNGVIIRTYCQDRASGTGYAGMLTVDGTYVLSLPDNQSQGGAMPNAELFVPAGSEIAVVNPAGGNREHQLTYDIL